MAPTRRVLALWLGVTLVGGLIYFSMDRCLRARLRYGVDIAQCPDGDTAVGVTMDANNLRRGEKGMVVVRADLLYALPQSMSVERAALSDFDVTLSLKRGDTVIPVVIDDAEARRQVDNRVIPFTLPKDLTDGDYTLTATVTASAGTATVTAPLALYAPAKVHVVTDRPLYEAGNTMMFRAVVLRARDLTPLDGRPGRFIVTDPTGLVVFDERQDATDFGIAAGELPLDTAAVEGQWHIRYETGGVSDDVTVDVHPFTLPRFTVSADADKPFYGAGDVPRVRVSAKTAAGVPMAATVRLDWRAQGAWPAPPEWLAALPKTITLPQSGTTTITMAPVPQDLVGKAAVMVTATATDDTGDEETGGGAVVLSKDAIDIGVVTELGQGDGAGLVEGMNNRVYLRATTAAGLPLPGAILKVTRAWDKKDPGVTATADVDGTAALQLDPGPAVNIVIPVMPVRLPPPPPEVKRVGVNELVRGGSPSLAELTALDALNPVVAPCSRYIDGSEGTPTVTLQVEPSGTIRNATGADDAARCIADAVRGRRLSAGGSRIFTLRYTLRPSLAGIEVTRSESGDPPDVVITDVERALHDARPCVGRMTTEARLPRVATWEMVGRRFTVRFVNDADGDKDVRLLGPAQAACIEQKLSRVLRDRTIGGASDDDDDEVVERYGVMHFAIDPVTLPGTARKAKAQTRLGYELLVTATMPTNGRLGEPIGSTKIFVAPGTIPPVRLRATPVVAKPGDTVTIEIVRGPDFQGELPKKLTLSTTDSHETVDVDAEKRRAVFTLPKDKDGWFETSFAGAITRVFVPRQTTLTVAVTPDKPVYRPGDTATLSVLTQSGDAGIAAAVGLFGVDETLGQLATLTGPGAMDRVVPTVTMTQSAFGVLDAMALSLGRIRGENAAAATVLFVSGVPSPEAFDVTTGTSGQSVFDPILPLADRFYGVLDAAQAEVRRFEATAPAGEKLTPARMLTLWDDAVKAATAKGVVTTDVFGRPLSLRVLPDELVAMADPRLLVRDGTRLPEDIQAWVPFVRSAR